MWLLTDVLQMQAARTPTATLWSPPFLGTGPSIVEVSNAPMPVAWWIVGCFFGGLINHNLRWNGGNPQQHNMGLSYTMVFQIHVPIEIAMWGYTVYPLYTPFSDTPIYIYISISINQSPGTLLFTSTKPALMDVHDVHPLISSVNIVGFDLFENQDISGYTHIYIYIHGNAI